MASVKMGNGSLEFCNLSIVDERVKDEVIEKLEMENFTVNLIHFDTMLTVIDACDKMTEDELVNRVDKEVVDSGVGFWSLISGIIPGTLWCGLNDIADNYHSLGPNNKVDRCCRAHDHCPDKIKSFSRKQGLLNSTPYTKSNCECDRRFYNCLKNSSSSTGDSVGNFYFNFLNLQCIELQHPERCTKWNHTDVNDDNKQVLVEDNFEQEEDIFIPDTLNADIEDTTNTTLVETQQTEENFNFTNSTTFEPEQQFKPTCLQWERDMTQGPKLTFNDNRYQY